MIASCIGYGNIVKALIEAGANVNEKSTWPGYTELMYGMFPNLIIIHYF